MFVVRTRTKEYPVTFIDESIWQGKVFSGGWRQASGGDAAVVEPATGAELTDIRWVTIRGEIAPYPF